MRHQAAAKQKHNHIRQHDPMARLIPRLVLRAVNVTADHTVQIAPPDHKPNSDAALIHALDIIRSPGDRIRDAGIDAQRAEKRARVFDAGRGGAEQHAEAGDAEEGGSDVAPAALAGAVGEPADEDGQDCGGGVGGHGEEVCGCGGVAELVYDCGQEEGEGVEGAVAAPKKLSASGSFLLHGWLVERLGVTHM